MEADSRLKKKSYMPETRKMSEFRRNQKNPKVEIQLSGRISKKNKGKKKKKKKSKTSLRFSHRRIFDYGSSLVFNNAIYLTKVENHICRFRLSSRQLFFVGRLFPSNDFIFFRVQSVIKSFEEKRTRIGISASPAIYL